MDENFEDFEAWLRANAYRHVLPEVLVGCRIRLGDNDYEIVGYGGTGKPAGSFVLRQLEDRAEYSW